MRIESMHFVVKVYSDTKYSITGHAELSNGDSIKSAETVYEGDGYLAMQEYAMNPEDTMDIIDLRGE